MRALSANEYCVKERQCILINAIYYHSALTAIATAIMTWKLFRKQNQYSGLIVWVVSWHTINGCRWRKEKVNMKRTGWLMNKALHTINKCRRSFSFSLHVIFVLCLHLFSFVSTTTAKWKSDMMLTESDAYRNKNWWRLIDLKCWLCSRLRTTHPAFKLH